MKFRNFRRPAPAEKHPRESAPKRARGGRVVMTDEDRQQYEEKAVLCTLEQ